MKDSEHNSGTRSPQSRSGRFQNASSQWLGVAVVTFLIIAGIASATAGTTGNEGPNGIEVPTSGDDEGPLDEVVNSLCGFTYESDQLLHSINACPGFLQQAWLSEYDRAGSADWRVTSLVVSPDGTKIYVTGESWSGDTGGTSDYGTVAYSAVDGTQLWASHYDGVGESIDTPLDMVASPDGSMVFVTGDSYSGTTANSRDFATVAYDASDGSELWTARYNGPGDGWDIARAISVSPDSSAVYVTGNSEAGSAASTADFATIAYDTADGSELWVARYNGPDDHHDSSKSMAVTPDGALVVVTGDSPGLGSARDFATVAYDATTGDEVWIARYNGPANAADWAKVVKASPDGDTVIVTGHSVDEAFAQEYATVAYSATDGTELWAARYDGPHDDPTTPTYLTDEPTDMVFSLDGSTLFVTGRSPGVDTNDDYATVAYDATDGTELWAARYDGPSSGRDVARGIAVSPDGSYVFVAGGSDNPALESIVDGAEQLPEYTTVAYGANTGELLDVARVPSRGYVFDHGAQAIGASPDGIHIFVTGAIQSPITASGDYVTVGYELDFDQLG